MIDVSIVIPVYNEAENIIETLTNIENKLLFAHEILIVYDMDNDNTLPVVKSFPPQERCQIRLLKNKYRSGALNAVKTGFEEADGEMIIVTMADLSDAPETINEWCKSKRRTGRYCLRLSLYERRKTNWRRLC